LEPKSGPWLFGQAVGRILFLYLFQNSASMDELHFLQAFQQHQAHPILNLYELEVIQCFEISCKYKFSTFFEELLNASM
jgi:hypothetical protein